MPKISHVLSRWCAWAARPPVGEHSQEARMLTAPFVSALRPRRMATQFCQVLEARPGNMACALLACPHDTGRGSDSPAPGMYGHVASGSD